MKQNAKSKSYCVVCVLCFTLMISLLFCFGCAKETTQILGVWWWDSELEVNEYLEFAKQNGVTEIYYCDSNLNKNTREFISKCDDKNIKVYLLDGSYKWLTDANKKQVLFQKLNNFVEFQNESNAKFAGVHLDIEPHQAPNFDDDREDLILSLIELMHELKQSYPSVIFEYDIPFWFEDEISFNGVTKKAFEHIIDVADKVTVMSYRDTAEQIVEVASDEIVYARSVNKTLNVSVETGEGEIDKVTFFEEGKQVLQTELEKVRKLIPENFGIVVHHVKTWKSLS